jgi:phenylalanyl-tRNA synthetase beta chain
VRLFEIGAVFRRGGGEAPVEVEHVAGVVTGSRMPPHWSHAGKSPDYDEWDMRAIFEEAARVTVGSGQAAPADGGWELRDGNGPRGWAGRLEADAPAWAAPLYGFELALVAGEVRARVYRPLPTTPPLERDVALVLPPGITAAAVEAVIRADGGPLLADLRIFDEYRGEELADARSVAWRLVFRAPDRTLRDEDADRALAKVLSRLKESLGVERRT